MRWNDNNNIITRVVSTKRETNIFGSATRVIAVDRFHNIHDSCRSLTSTRSVKWHYIHIHIIPTVKIENQRIHININDRQYIIIIPNDLRISLFNARYVDLHWCAAVLCLIILNACGLQIARFHILIRGGLCRLRTVGGGWGEGGGWSRLSQSIESRRRRRLILWCEKHNTPPARESYNFCSERIQRKNGKCFSVRREKQRVKGRGCCRQSDNARRSSSWR